MIHEVGVDMRATVQLSQFFVYLFFVVLANKEFKELAKPPTLYPTAPKRNGTPQKCPGVDLNLRPSDQKSGTISIAPRRHLQ